MFAVKDKFLTETPLISSQNRRELCMKEPRNFHPELYSQDGFLVSRSGAGKFDAVRVISRCGITRD